MRRLFVLLAAFLSFGANASDAGIITFSGLTGNNGDPFTTYTEIGFNVSVTSGSWSEGHLFGNPAPSIFGTSTTGSVNVARANSGTFTFSGVDLANANFSNTSMVTYTLQGFLGATPEFMTTGSLVGGTSAFVTVSSPNTTQAIDRLVITESYAIGTSYNIDNIVVNPLGSVPEPATLGMLTIGLAGAATGLGVRRLRRA